MKRVWIAQLLCPSRHCVIGAAAECERDSEVADLIGKVQRNFDEAVAARLLNPWCDICESRTLHVEAGRTPFTSIDDAMSTLLQCELDQMRTADAIKQSKQN